MSQLINKILKNKSAYLFIFPTVISVILFGVYPILYVLRYSFTNYSGFGVADFTGLENYIRVIKDIAWWKTVITTIQMGFLIAIIQIPLALFFAILLNMKLKGLQFFRAAIFLPNITSSAVMGLVFFFIFASYNGIINGYLMSLGIISAPIEWLGIPMLAKLVIVLFCVWSSLGFYMVLFLAALQKIPEEIYESSRIDGANKIQTFTKITFPMLGKMFQLVSSLAIIGALKLFDSVKTLTNGGPGNTTEVMTMYIYRYFFETEGIPQRGYASAVSIVATIIVGIITISYMALTKKMDYEN